MKILAKTLFVLIFGCCISTKLLAQPTGTVVVSIGPFYNICSYVLGEVAKPELLLEGNSSPHNYQLKPSDVSKINEASLVIWGGIELEPYLAKVMTNPAIPSLDLALIPGLKLYSLRNDNNWQHVHAHSQDHEHDHHHHDPHYWLYPDNAKLIAEAIASSLGQIDPANAKYYQTNAKNFANKLDRQTTYWHSNLQQSKINNYLVFHDAYQYLEQYFKLPAEGAIAIHPEIPLSAKRLQELQELLQRKDVSCIYREPQFNAKHIETISEGLDVELGVLDPIGESANLGPDGYFKLIDNLLSTISQCGN